MVQSCLAINCTSRRTNGSNLKCHRIPKDPNIRNLWLNAIRREAYNPGKTVVICEKHFKQGDYEVNVRGNRVFKCESVLPVSAYSAHLKKEVKTRRIPKRNIIVLGGYQAKATYGTGCFLLYNTGTIKVSSAHGLITTVAYQLGPKAPPMYALEGSVAIAGAALNWLKDNMNLLPSFGDAQKIAEQAELKESGEVYFVPAFSGLYAPYWQQEARGVIIGISEDTQGCHIVRAALEAVCYQTRDILEAMNKDYGSHLTTMQVDGGMTANSLLMQLQADLAGIKIAKPLMAESTSLGAAMVAGAAVGHWDLSHPLDISCETWSPKMSEDERDISYAKWKLAVEKSMGWDVL